MLLTISAALLHPAAVSVYGQSFDELAELKTGNSIHTANLPTPGAAYGIEKIGKNEEIQALGPMPEDLAFLMRPPADYDPEAPVIDIFSMARSKGYADADIPYLRIAAMESAMQGVDLELVLAIMMKESSFNPKAHNKKYGASGLMQLLPGVAKWMGLKNAREIWRPEVNIKYGVKYLKYLSELFDDPECDIAALKADDVSKNMALRRIIAAYNAGPGTVAKYMKGTHAAKYSGIPPFRETRNYLVKVDEYFREFKDLNLQTRNSLRPPAR